MNAIEIKDLSKSYSGFTLKKFSLNIPEGSVVGLVGENGAGKSTTINLIMNAQKRDSGLIKVLGTDNTAPEFTNIKQDIGVVLDEAYYPEILNAIQVGNIMQRTYKNWDAQIYQQYLKKFDLPLKKQFKDYSRGMKMKLAITVALSHNPKLLILDEATSGLDPMIRDEILDIFNDFTRDPNHTILLSSHIVSDLEKICDYIAFIHKGKLLFCEEKDLLLQEYAIAKVTQSGFESIPKSAIVGCKRQPYGYDVLLKQSSLPSNIQKERITLEYIILLLAKGDNSLCQD